MSIIKKINNKNVVLADKGVRDHNLLMGRDSYGAHPITAILGLTDRLNTIETNIGTNTGNITSVNTKIGRIQLVDNQNDSFTFTNGENQSTTISLIPSSIETINSTLNSHANLISACNDKDTQLEGAITNNLTSAKNYTDSEIADLSRAVNARIDLLDGQGGYLTPYNFGSSVTQSALTNYALQELNLNNNRDIPNLLRVKNTHDSNVWVLTNSASIFQWTNEGVDAIEVASLDSYGVVKSSNEDYEGSVDSLGHISINGLTEKLSDLEGEINTLNGISQNISKISVLTYYSTLNGKFPGLTASNIEEIASNFRNSKLKVIEFTHPDTNEIYTFMADSVISKSNEIVVFINFNTEQTRYNLKYILNTNTNQVSLDFLQ